MSAGCSNCFRQESKPVVMDGKTFYWVLTAKEPLFSEPQRQKQVAFLPFPTIKEDQPEIENMDLFCSACFEGMMSGGSEEAGETADVY